MRRFAGPAVLVIAAAVAGYVLARAGSGSSSAPALNRTLSTGAFAVRYPSAWKQTGAGAMPGVLSSGAIGLAPSDGTGERLSLGTSSASTLGALPTAFLHSLKSRPHPATVELGGRRFDRYLDLHLRGRAGVTSLYLLATSRQTIAAACVAPRSGSAFTAQCERVLATLHLPAGTTVSGSVDAAYALALNQVLSRLDRVRTSAGPGLRSSSVATRARSADRLAAAESVAAAAATKLSAGSAQVVNRAIAGALGDAAQAYHALAAAGRSGDRNAYNAAAARLMRAQKQLTAAFRKLAALGYHLR